MHDVHCILRAQSSGIEIFPKNLEQDDGNYLKCLGKHNNTSYDRISDALVDVWNIDFGATGDAIHVEI